jgi:hypothetical protein
MGFRQIYWKEKGSCAYYSCHRYWKVPVEADNLCRPEASQNFSMLYLSKFKKRGGSVVALLTAMQ